MSEHQGKMVILGQLGAAHGVHGWLKVTSYTDPDTNILDYPIWQLSTHNGWEPIKLLGKRIQGPHLVVQLDGCDNSELAKCWTGRKFAISRDELPSADDDEFYWTDLEGLTVRTTSGQTLGQVDHLIEVGSRDVMVILGGEEPIQVPFVMHETVCKVDLEQGEILVEWEPE